MFLPCLMWMLVRRVPSTPFLGAMIASAWLAAATPEAHAQTVTDGGEVSDAGSRVPERSVEGNRLVSQSDPVIEIEVLEEARYLGADRIVINDRFDAELHVFAEADPAPFMPSLIS